jgi:hypothetical protein
MPLSSGSVWVEEQEAGSWGTTESGRQSTLEEHGLATVGAEHFGRGWCFGCFWMGLRGRGGGCELAEVLLDGHEPCAQGGTKEAIVADLHKASGKHMLEETLHEFLGRERTLLELPGVGGAVLEGDLGRFHAAAVQQADQAAIAKRHAADIGRQIAKRCLPIAHGFAMHDPVLLPNVGWDLCKEGSFLQQTLEGGTKQLGERLHGHEEIVMSLAPGPPIRMHTTARNEVVHVGMVGEVAGSGMQDAHQPNLPTHKARIMGKLLGGLCGSPKKQVVHALLVLAGKLAEFSGEGEGQQEVRNGQQQFLLQLEPFFGSFLLAFGAMTVAAGVVAVTGFVTSWAVIDLSAQGCGAAVLNRPHGLAVAGQQFGGVLLAISGTILAKDIRQF